MQDYGTKFEKSHATKLKMKIRIKYSMLLLGLFFLLGVWGSESAWSQDKQRTLKVQTAAEVDIPADQILFSIQIQIESDSPKKAFRQHRDRERYLARLIRKSGIEDSQISFQPVRISKVDRHRPVNGSEKLKYRTNQQVRLRLNDFALFDTMQVQLIENGFDTFSAQFQSSKTKDGRKKALNKALKKARNKAHQIAEQMNVRLGPVKQINYSSGNGNQPVYRAADMMQRSSESMMDFAQTLSVSESVHVIYYIKND